MKFTALLFYCFEALAAGAAISLVFIRNVFYGALALLICLLALAGIYVLAYAEFIAVTQILIYAGGILVVIIFGIMLTSKLAGKPLVVNHTNLFSGTLAAVAFFGLVIYTISQQSFYPAQPAAPLPAGYNTVNYIGIGLMSSFMLPFEIAGILLLVTLIGAAVLASSTKSEKV